MEKQLPSFFEREEKALDTDLSTIAEYSILLQKKKKLLAEYKEDVAMVTKYDEKWDALQKLIIAAPDAEMEEFESKYVSAKFYRQDAMDTLATTSKKYADVLYDINILRDAITSTDAFESINDEQYLYGVFLDAREQNNEHRDAASKRMWEWYKAKILHERAADFPADAKFVPDIEAVTTLSVLLRQIYDETRDGVVSSHISDPCKEALEICMSAMKLRGTRAPTES